MENAPGKTMLKVVGILYIVFSGITVVLGLMTLLAALAVGVASLGLGAIALVAAVIVLITGGFGLVAGIIAVANCGKLEKASLCFNMGLALIGLQVVNVIFSIVSQSFNPVSVVVGLVLPVLYVVGANKNKQAANNPM